MDRKILNNATTPKPDPTPAWMYSQIAKMTTDSVEACRAVEHWLLKRLKVDNPHVKKKVLLIIKNVARLGDPDFAKSFVMHSEAIRECTRYRGPKDPIHGDSFNLAVRQAASEAMEALFAANEKHETKIKFIENIDKSLSNGITNETYSSRIGTYPGDRDHSEYRSTFDTTGIGSTSSMKTTQQQGIGYASIHSLTVCEGWISSGVEKLTTWWKGNKGTDQDKFSSFLGNDRATNTFKPPVIPGTDEKTFSDEDNLPRQRGTAPGWESKTEKEEKSSGSHEANIVNEFTSKTGVRIAPSKKALQEFCQRCENVNATQIAEHLDKKLESSTWQVRLKALYGIEALIANKNAAITNYFTNSFENIQKLTNVGNESIVQKATKILQMLNISDEKPSSQSQSETKTQKKKPQKDTTLIDIGLEKPEQSNEDDIDDMFAEMNIKETPHEEKNTSLLPTEDKTIDLFSEPITQQPTQQATQSTQQSQKTKPPVKNLLDEIFGDLPSMNTQKAPSPVQTTIPSTVPTRPISTISQYGNSPVILVPVPQTAVRTAPISGTQPVIFTPMVPGQRRVIPQKVNQETQQGFEFIGKQNDNNDHFSFVKQELTQQVKKM